MTSQSPKLPTFAKARANLQAALRAAGWALSPSLNPQGRPYKVPYADSPSGRVRVWFKPQALYYSRGTTLAEARSFSSDIRELDPARFVERFERIVE